jgi:glutamyl-tRNA synthetase
MSNIVVRMAPSPTGFLHLGTARTALFNWLFAKKKGGEFILRMEDTDVLRSKKEFEEDILAGLEWLGLSYDNFYRQSERGEVYTKYLKEMVKEGKAYLSKEEASEGKRTEVIRLKNPGKDIIFTDLLRGEITFNTKELGDFVIAKSITEPLYHLAVVIDDFEMKVTDIIRGEDGISNTPRQILIQEALGAPRPNYVHVPFILAPDRSKLSKRHGAISILEYKKEGFLPEAVVNFLALLGWHPEGDREIFSLLELISVFDISRVQKGGATFDREKLLWINSQHLKQKSLEEKYALLMAWLPENLQKKVLEIEKRSREAVLCLVDLVFERVSILGEITKNAQEGEYSWLLGLEDYKENLLLGKKREIKKEVALESLEEAKNLFEKSEEMTDKDEVKNLLWPKAEQMGRANFLWPVRTALSGKRESPDPFSLATILGKEETISRLNSACQILKK